MLFDVAVTDRDGWTVLGVVGDLDVATAPRLRQEVVRVATSTSPRVVLDLGGVDFLDSTGLGVVVGSLKRVRGLGGELRVVGDSSGVRRVFELTGMTAILPLHASVAEAIAEPVDPGPEVGGGR